MKESTKTRLGIISILPLIAFIVWLIYLLFLNHRLIASDEFHQHEKVVTLLFNNYDNLLLLLALAFILGAAVLIYFMIHIKKLATMNGSTKLAWFVFMMVFGPLSFPVVWYIEMRHEPEDVPMYDSIEHGVG